MCGRPAPVLGGNDKLCCDRAEPTTKGGTLRSGPMEVLRMNSATRSRQTAAEVTGGLGTARAQEPDGLSLSSTTPRQSPRHAFSRAQWGQSPAPPRRDASKVIGRVSGTQYSEYSNNVMTIKHKQRPSQQDSTRICQPFQSRTSVWSLWFPQNTPFGVKTPEFESWLCYW